MQRILVVGAGFAGLWSAVGAARQLDELGIGSDRVEVLVINRTAWHSIRVRNYDADLSHTRVLLSDVLDPIGVKHWQGEVTNLDIAMRRVACLIEGTERHVPYDRLVFVLGSRLVRPPDLRRTVSTSTLTRLLLDSMTISAVCHLVQPVPANTPFLWWAVA
ncbi:MAG: hypothetical protein JOY71_30565 [Acetobacteraceae bacterium]|nr:hypothetical protein [Acetobacteraceae bacterium]MBV8526407.1 hypothetical protein [Acetobacteraceae bacterium]